MLRFGQSPTGDMHIRNLRFALFNFILSKQLNEDLLIRIEDTNKEKNIEGKDKEILEMLSLFSIDYKSVVYQSENLKYHQKMAMQLMSKKRAFSCFCSDAKLEEIKEEAKKNEKPYMYDGFCEKLSDETVLNCNAPFTVRLSKPTKSIKFKDLLKGEIVYEASDIDSFIILNHDKTPTYNYASAIDDMLYDISIVIRGDDHILNTPKQIEVRKELNYDKNIDYIHLPAILNAKTGERMSKKDDISNVRWLIDKGFLPSAIANYLVLLGSNTPKEIFTLEEAIQWFDIKKISKDAVCFDIDKLRDINIKHLESMDDMRLSKILGFADTDIGKLGKIYLKEASTIDEIKRKVDAIFSSKNSLKDFENEFKILKECLNEAPFINDYDEFIKYLTNKTKLEDKFLFEPLRFILTGTNSGPLLSDIYPLIRNYIGEIVK